MNLALLHAKTKAPTYLYEFDRAPDTVRTRLGGAPHASERAYVFGNLANAPWPAGAEDQSLAEEMGLRWRAFARAGEPSIPGGAPWPRVGAKPRALRFDHGTVAAFEPPPTGLLRLFHTDGAAEHSRRRR